MHVSNAPGPPRDVEIEGDDEEMSETIKGGNNAGLSPRGRTKPEAGEHDHDHTLPSV